LVAFGESGPYADLPLPPGTEFFRQPAQDKIKDIYAKCDVWLCGSWSEGFHLPPLEAMACRCPVVSTRVGGPQDLIQDGINGYLVPCGDVDALADRLVRLLTLSDVQWKAMSDAAYSTAHLYTWEGVTERFEQALYVAVERSHTTAMPLAVG
jgi:glycosyltransferase involved in cell wall biosynthesis